MRLTASRTVRDSSEDTRGQAASFKFSRLTVKRGEKSLADGRLVRRRSASLSFAKQKARTHTNELIVTIPINVTII